VASRWGLLLAVGYLAALGLAAYEYRRAPTLAVPPAPPEPEAALIPSLELPPTVVHGIAAYDEIVERPLFSPERRPEAAEAAAEGTEEVAEAEEPVVEVDGFRLTAVLKDGDKTTVLIEDRSGQTRVLHDGDRLDNWSLGEVLDDRIELIDDGRRETLMVYDFSSPADDAQSLRINRRIARPRLARPPRPAPAPPDPEQIPDQP
jgi:hypothetical protein